MEGDAERNGAILRPYLPRLAVEWLADEPGTTWRELDGTVAFVDVSGFTKLSERLARRGKVGAEELTETIGSCFRELLAVAYDDGGSLLKFGGDALLLLYTGTDHALRACRAAHGMRATLRRVGNIATPGGNVRLRMSVGLHTGTFHFFLVGGEHRELFVTGPAATQTTLMEQTAEAGEIVISPATAECLPARCVGAAKGPGVLLRSAPSTARMPAGSPAITTDVSAGIPVAIREHLLAGGCEPEHRRATVTFIRFEGADEVIGREGPECMAEKLDALVRTVQTAAGGRGVAFLSSDIDRDGGKIILTAGAPRSTGADEEAALLAARQIVDASPPLPLRLGVNHGHVFAGDIGPDYRRTYTVMGDTVNLAARLMAAATPGEIYAATEVVERSRTAFSTRALEPFMVKGKAKPVHAVSVGRPRDDTPRDAAPDIPFVGRERELGILLDALEQASDGGRVVEVIGEPGMGASRLVQEAVARASDAAVLQTAGGPYAAGTPYFPFRTLLREVIGIPPGETTERCATRLREMVSTHAPELAPWLPLLGAILDLSLEPTKETAALDDRFRRARLEQTAVEFLGAVFPQRTLFVFEDVHYFDEASAELLRRLVASAEGRPWLVLLTRRAGRGTRFVSDQPHARTLGLSPLDHELATQLVEAVTGDAPPSEHELNELVTRSGGNPMFLRELLSAWRVAGTIEGLPDTVESLMTARIDGLAPIDRNVLRAAAVLGTSFDGALMTAVLGDGSAPDDPVWRRLEHFLKRDERGWYRFSNVLIRDAAYGGLTYRRRRALHAAVGERIMAAGPAAIDEQTELLALHFFHAQRWTETWRFARVAGERAQAKYANVEAARFYGLALEAARKLDGIGSEELAEVAERLGDVQRIGGEYHKAQDAYRLARRLAKERAGVWPAQILLKHAQVADRVGRLADALRWTRRGLTALEGVEGIEAGRLRARLAAWYGAIRQGQGRYEDAISWSRRAIAEGETTGEKSALAQAYVILDWTAVSLGRPTDHSASFRALEIYEELGDVVRQAVVLNNLGAYAYWEGRWDEAVLFYERGRLAREQTGDPVSAALGTVNVGEILADQGRLAEAEPMLRHVVRVCRGAGDRSSVAFALGVLGRVQVRAGRLDEGLASLREARREYEAVGEHDGVIDIDARIAESLVLRGDVGAAITLAGDTLAAARAGDEDVTVQAPILLRVLGLGLMRLGQDESAREALDEGLRAARSRSADYEAALTLRAIGQLDRARGVAEGEPARESAEILARLGVIAVADPPGFTADVGPPSLPVEEALALEETREARTITLEPLADPEPLRGSALT